MPDYVTDGKIGIDLTATYASTSAGSTTLFPVTPGTRVSTSNNGTYIFVRAESTLQQLPCDLLDMNQESCAMRDKHHGRLLDPRKVCVLCQAWMLPDLF